MTHEQAIDLAPAYVLGALEAADMAAVREHLATCPESHLEFETLGSVVPYLLESSDIELVEPSAGLRDRIMAAAAADLAARSAGTGGRADDRLPVGNRTSDTGPGTDRAPRLGDADRRGRRDRRPGRLEPAPAERPDRRAPFRSSGPTGDHRRGRSRAARPSS